MRDFLNENFLLLNKPAVELYHNYAKKQPIIDYHCHLNPEEVSSNRQFKNLTQIWLNGDHYKWRAMRALGVDEDLITGNASDYDKFLAWAECVPKTIGNPLFHWVHLELKRPFGITNKLLDKNTAKEIWEQTNSLLATDRFTTHGIIKKMNVEIICTTDDPIDDLKYHKNLQMQNKDFNMYPTFRPDKAMAIDKIDEYILYIHKLESVTDMVIKNYTDLLIALEQRHNYFHNMGCRLSDHSLSQVEYEDYTFNEVSKIFSCILLGNKVMRTQASKFRTALFQFFGRLNSNKNWTMQIHIGAQRNNNTRMFKKLGPDTGFDSISDGLITYPLARLLDSLDKTNELPKTIIYPLNPADNDTIASMLGNFQDGSIHGKIQFGSGWWFNDQKTGMIKQMESLANMGILSQFIGMLTDSRSFLSYTRHEYFRRILCNILGTWVTNGEVPEDYSILGQMVEDICYNNSKNYFQFVN